MDIRNQRKNNIICRAEEARGIMGRALGLMFKKNLDSDAGLLMSFRRGNVVHSVFMRFPIDLIFLNAERKVVELHTLKPWSFYKPKYDCHWLIEVNEGVIKEKKIEIGDGIEFT